MGTEILDEVFRVIKDRRDNPKPESYVSGLLKKGLKAVEGKVEEESAEVIEAADGEDRDAIVHEVADLIFHTMVLLGAKGVELEEVMDELRKRRR
jgi:phosphoribosyl-ATP pyrophosphohydrolase